MAEFKLLGKTIQVTVDGPKIRAVRSAHDVDLAKSDGSAFKKLGDDPLLAEDVLWTLCGPSSGIDEAAFREALTGDEGEAAARALRRAVIDFFPKSKRDILLKLSDQTDLQEEKILSAALAKVSDSKLMDDMTTRLLARMDAEIEAILSGTTPPTNATD